ncbi:MAG: ThuA domain-containing protein [Phycisphaeraceae bacterium]|nr:ThuA domain-containing protein [Phycisphaeraceae bacterium]
MRDRMPRALILSGGWEGHTPEAVATFARERLLPGFEVERSWTLESLRREALSAFDVLLPIWTFDEITRAQERALLEAVEDGLGVLAWHGATSAFLHSRAHKHMLGGQFVAHPGGDATRYTVRFRPDHPLTRGLGETEFVSEQYSLLVDPAVEVLATTVMEGAEKPWLRGVTMPQAWTRMWGEGRVFYCAIGHTVADLGQPSIVTLLQRAARWAARVDDVPEVVVTGAQERTRSR